jgi:hypothetical protein
VLNDNGEDGGTGEDGADAVDVGVIPRGTESG